MSESVPTSEKSANLLVGILLAGGGLIFILLNFTVLPVIGLFVGIIFLVIGAVFLAKHNKHLSQKRRNNIGGN